MNASEAVLPQADQLEPAPHPRETKRLIGQESAEAVFLRAAHEGQMPHAWLIQGPEGIGKATLAWKIARAMLAGLDRSSRALETPPDTPLNHRVTALSEPRLALCRRGFDEKAKKFKTVITVEESRRLKASFALSSADGGWRVAIIDSADEMNGAAANAILKLVEEPPEKCLFLLISHQPSRLLPTLRSRCHRLACRPLGADALKEAVEGALPGTELSEEEVALAGGSVRRALELHLHGGAELYGRMLGLLAQFPKVDHSEILALAEIGGLRDAGRASLLFDLLLQMVSRLARACAGQEAGLSAAERVSFARHMGGLAAAQHWAETGWELMQLVQSARLVHLDPSHIFLDMWLKATKTAATLGRLSA